MPIAILIGDVRRTIRLASSMFQTTGRGETEMKRFSVILGIGLYAMHGFVFAYCTGNKFVDSSTCARASISMNGDGSCAFKFSDSGWTDVSKNGFVNGQNLGARCINGKNGYKAVTLTHPQDGKAWEFYDD